MNVWHPHSRELWPGTYFRADGRTFSPGVCSVHNCVEVVVRKDRMWRCLLCDSDERYFIEHGKPHKQMLHRYEAWREGRFMDWQPPSE